LEQVPWAFDGERGDRMAARVPDFGKWENGNRTLRHRFGVGSQFVVAREFLYAWLKGEGRVPGNQEVAAATGVAEEAVRKIKKAIAAAELAILPEAATRCARGRQKA
jgi:hypothetical protein